MHIFIVNHLKVVIIDKWKAYPKYVIFMILGSIIDSPNPSTIVFDSLSFKDFIIRWPRIARFFKNWSIYLSYFRKCQLLHVAF